MSFREDPGTFPQTVLEERGHQFTTLVEGEEVAKLFGVSGTPTTDWLLKVPQPTREHMNNDVTAYMRYYNLERLHTANGDLTPIEYEQNSLRKVS